MKTKLLRTMLIACLMSLIIMPITVSAKTVTKYVQSSSANYEYNSSTKKWEEYFTTSSTYTAKGVIKKHIANSIYRDENGKKVTDIEVTTYNKNGKIKKSVSYPKGKKANALVTTYKYNKKGILIKGTTVDTKGKTVSVSTYNSKGKIKSEKRYENGNVVSEIDYTYDSKGNIESMKSYENGELLCKTTCTYKYKKGVVSQTTYVNEAPDFTSKNVITFYTTGAKKGQAKKDVFSIKNENGKYETASTSSYSYTFNKNKKISKVICKSSDGYSYKTTYKYKKISYKK